MAVEVPSGERLWETIGAGEREDAASTAARRLSCGTAIATGCSTTAATWSSPSSRQEGYEELDRVKIIEPTNNAFGRDVVWCMPAFANKKLFVRNDAECICVDLAAK